MYRIVLAGQMRGTSVSWTCLENLKQHLCAKIYIGSYEKWDVPFEADFIKTHKIDFNLKKSTHIDSHKYIHQWSSLYLTWEYFNELFNDTDIIIKIRNDIIFEPFNIVTDDNTIHVPSIEMHMEKEFDKLCVCNDQIVIGDKKTMSKYFRFPFDYDFDKNFLPSYYNFGYHMGIEALLRNYFYQQSIEIKTFNLKYKRHENL